MRSLPLIITRSFLIILFSAIMNQTLVRSTSALPENSLDPYFEVLTSRSEQNIRTQNTPDNLTEIYTHYLPYIEGSSSFDWPMVAANPQRTSWTPSEVIGDLHVEWYRPLEAFISPKVQIIASGGLVYISTSRGLYALSAASGSLVWRFDTEMPLGNSPTVFNGVIYVGGFDHKLHALNASTGSHLWAFEGAEAGYDTNPLVVDGKVILGNRDGYMYAIGAHGTPQQGQLIWSFKTEGAIHLSAAYKNGVVYFASNDNYAYALEAHDGNMLWKSERLPGDGYQSYWPVIFRGYVIFSGASPYRVSRDPGTRSVNLPEGTYDKFLDLDKVGVWPYDPDGTLIGDEVPDQPWAHGYPIIDASRITQYYEANPIVDPYKYKPWRRILSVLSLTNGTEFTYDSDTDGYSETIPFTIWGTHSGNRYPPIVGPDNILYSGNLYRKFGIPQGRVMGWNLETPGLLSFLGGLGAIDEPYSLSAGGNNLYRVSGSDIGDWFSIIDPGRVGALWDYSRPLSELAPGFDEMIATTGHPEWYTVYGTSNGIYHTRGDENVLVPYGNRLFIHRENSIIAFGTGPQLGKLPTVEIVNAVDQARSLTDADLQERLEKQIQKMIESGHLRPAYQNVPNFFPQLNNFFENPGETLYTLTRAYPYISAELQGDLRNYLREEFYAYFDPIMYSSIGWADGNARESVPLPPEVSASLNNFPAQESPHPGWSWNYPQYNFYAMWKYAQIFPADAVRVYELAKSKLQVPVSDWVTDDYLNEYTWELNGYIAGYIGFLELQEIAGRSDTDSQLRTEVDSELNRLLQLRVAGFDKNSPWALDTQSVTNRHLNIARNFMFLVPELGNYLDQHIRVEVEQALEEYNAIAPFWFVTRFEAVHDEGVITNPYNAVSLYQAKAYILMETRPELSKYLDVPAFERGDLYYIQNIIATIEANNQ